MENKKAKNAVLLIISILSLLTAGALVLVLVLTKAIELNAMFSDLAWNGYMEYWKFGSFAMPIPLIVFGTIAAAVLFVIDLILLIVKKRVLYLASAIIAFVGMDCAGYLLHVLYGVMGNPAIVHIILVYAAYGLSLLSLLLCFIILCASKKRAVVEKEEPVAKEEPTSEPRVEAAAPIEYEGPGSALNYAEEPVGEESADESVEGAGYSPANSGEPVPKGNKVLGKYEIFPEAGFFKYRLKANNGEILLVSNGYRTREGARNGIVTLKRNVPNGISKIITDKNGFSQFRIFTQNDARLIVAGEFYSSSASAQKALNSVQRFYLNEKIVDLDEIPESEVREWKVDLPPMNPTKNGKFEVYIDEETKKWQGRLAANNGATLFVTSTYSSKNAVLNAFVNIKNKVVAGDLDVARDKQNRYHFRIISENGSVILMGETYPSRDSAISAAMSVRNFIQDAKTIDLSRGI